MVEYIFVLGRTSELCRAEIEAVLIREKIIHKVVFFSSEIFHISTSKPLDANYLIQTLGGTIKIAEVVEEVKDGDEEIIIDKLTTLIQRSIREGESKITFGLSGYGDYRFNDINHCSRDLKDSLAKIGLRARFILPTEGTTLSSVVIKKQNVLEIIIATEEEKIILAKNLVVQDFEDWGKRDFGRPAPDPHRGMLPPKVARMMVNLGISTIQDRNKNVATILDRKAILDPFCGVGTILAEGIMLGCKVIGSDQSKEAIEKTKKNLEWLRENYQLPITNYQLLCVDATHISEKLPHSSIDAIVTEPYLGPAIEIGNWKLEIGNLDNIILGLEKLYIGCFRDWWKILKAQGTIVIALPSFRIGKREFFVKKPLDTCENLGYTFVSGPYQYSRPQAIVVRNISLLKKS